MVSVLEQLLRLWKSSHVYLPWKFLNCPWKMQETQSKHKMRKQVKWISCKTYCLLPLTGLSSFSCVLQRNDSTYGGPWNRNWPRQKLPNKPCLTMGWGNSPWNLLKQRRLRIWVCRPEFVISLQSWLAKYSKARKKTKKHPPYIRTTDTRSLSILNVFILVCIYLLSTGFTILMFKTHTIPILFLLIENAGIINDTGQLHEQKSNWTIFWHLHKNNLKMD